MLTVGLMYQLIFQSILAVWEQRRERLTAEGAEATALSGTGKVVTMFQRMNIAFSEDESLVAVSSVTAQFGGAIVSADNAK